MRDQMGRDVYLMVNSMFYIAIYMILYRELITCN